MEYIGSHYSIGFRDASFTSSKKQLLRSKKMFKLPIRSKAGCFRVISRKYELVITSYSIHYTKLYDADKSILNYLTKELILNEFKWLKAVLTNIQAVVKKVIEPIIIQQ